MSVMPRDALAKIAFCENHNPTWNTVATSIGTTTTEVGALVTKTTAARAAFNAQQLAQEQARTATQAFKDAVGSMSDACSDIIKKIRAKAATDGNSVYNLALIPVPATPAPVGPPGTPTNFSVALQQNGALVLKWKCANPVGASGTIYQVSRKVGGGGEFTFIGASGQRKFTDATLPSGGGGGSVTYQIVAIRSTTSGAPAQFNVNFGVGGAGEMIASVATAPRIAA